MSIGLPYAETITKGNMLFRKCPACSLHIAERTDKVGEQTTNHYGEHYILWHEEDTGLDFTV